MKIDAHEYTTYPNLSFTNIDDWLRERAILDTTEEPIKSLSYHHWYDINLKFNIDLLLDITEKCTILFKRSSKNYVSMSVKPDKVLNPCKEGTCIINYSFDGHDLFVMVYCTHVDEAKRLFEEVMAPKITEILKPFKEPPKKENVVQVAFSMIGVNCKASVISRNLYCPPWKELKNNYPNINPKIEWLLNLTAPDEKGKFVFWHGEPGAGKSFLIRGLLNTWKEDARFYYITDPENFFTNSTYMNDLIIFHTENNDNTTNYASAVSPSDLFDLPYEEEYTYKDNNSTKKLAIFIIEDGMDFLLAKDSTLHSSGVSRFLNLTDGILGQGLRLLFIVTSNRPVTDIEPAYLRPGRCLQRIEFPSFDLSSAITWLKNQGVKDTNIDEAVKGKTKFSLAELYTIKEGDVREGSLVQDKKIGITMS